MSGDVDYFADEIQTRDFAALHCLRGKFARADAASGHLGLFESLSGRGNDFPVVNPAFKFKKSLVGERSRRMKFEPSISETVGQHFPNRSARACCISEFAVTKSGRDLATRSEVDVNCAARLPVRRDLQDRRATQSAMGDQHFFTEMLMIGSGHDLSRNACQIAIAGAVFCAQHKGNEPGPGWLNLNPNCFATS